MEQGEQVEELAEACALCRTGAPVRWAGYRLRWVHGGGVQLTTSCAANHLRPEPQVTVEDAELVGGRA